MPGAALKFQLVRALVTVRRIRVRGAAFVGPPTRHTARTNQPTFAGSGPREEVEPREPTFVGPTDE